MHRDSALEGVEHQDMRSLSHGRYPTRYLVNRNEMRRYVELDISQHILSP